jgi:hypothetical protein
VTFTRKWTFPKQKNDTLADHNGISEILLYKHKHLHFCFNLFVKSFHYFNA